MKLDPQKINLSLVSHTNVGKTTLARTLLGKDIGEIEDRSHVTTEPKDYVLLRSPDDNMLILWDTPGFGDSVRLAKRLEGRSNPIGWFTSEVWDRLTDKTLWLNQQAVRHVKDQSNIILYLVNASEPPEAVSYVKAEMNILSWIDKPVIVLLNQIGEIRPRDEENKEILAWQDYLKDYNFVSAVLPLDAFARCWVQEYQLWDEIEKALGESEKPIFASLKSTWRRQKQAIYASSVEAMASHLSKLLVDKEVVKSQSLVDRLLSIGRSLRFIKADLHGAMKDAQIALSTRASDEVSNLTQQLVSINNLEGKGTKSEILRRMRTDLVTKELMDPKAASIIGGVVAGVGTGIGADIVSGGLTFGMGAILGAIAGALGAAGVAAAYNVSKGTKENQVSWSPEAMKGFTLEAILLYLAVAHFGRGRGQWEESESPSFWKGTVEKILDQDVHEIDFAQLAKAEVTADQRLSELTNYLDGIIRDTFKELYDITI